MTEMNMSILTSYEHINNYEGKHAPNRIITKIDSSAKYTFPIILLKLAYLFLIKDNYIQSLSNKYPSSN